MGWPSFRAVARTGLGRVALLKRGEEAFWESRCKYSSQLDNGLSCFLWALAHPRWRLGSRKPTVIPALATSIFSVAGDVAFVVRNVSPRWLDSAYYTTLAVSVSSSCCHQKSPQRHIKKLSGEALHMKRVNQKHLHDSQSKTCELKSFESKPFELKSFESKSLKSKFFKFKFFRLKF